MIYITTELLKRNMTFDTINYLLFKKRNTTLDSELLNDFNPWLTNKMFSFYENGNMTTYVNDTLNIYGNILNSKEDQFKMYENIIPILPYKKIKYLKKSKTDKNLDKIPIPEFYSKREIDLFEDMNKYSHE